MRCHAALAPHVRRRRRHLPQVHRGAAAFAEGCHAGIRNPNRHEDGLPELPEHEALEQLAALSVPARWVDTSVVSA